MKVLKALLAVLTALAVALTAALLFIQDKNAPPSLSGTPLPGLGDLWFFAGNNRRKKRPARGRGFPCAGSFT